MTLAPPVAGDDAALAVVASPRGRRLALWSALIAALALTTGGLLTSDADGVSTALAFIGEKCAPLAAIRWPFVAIVLTLGATRYAAAAVSVRAAAGISTAFGETLLVQFAAAAANRLTVGGLGAAATNARFLTRRGLTATTSVGAITAMGLLGGLASSLVLVGLVLGSTWLGFSGANQVGALKHHLEHLLRPLHSPWLLLGVLATIAAVAVVISWRRHRGKRVADLRQLVRPAIQLLSHPRRLATVMGCSAATTLVLGLAFAASTAAIPGAHASVGVAGLLIAYMLGGVAGGASPLPAGIGATEAALTALLVTDHIPAAQALQVVVLFRVLTFWLPAAIGVPAVRYLRKRHAL